jgi:hypothetical protein
VKPPENIGESELCRRILSYLAEHPQAQDTIEGIAQWWLQDPQLQPSGNRLQKALDYLTAQHLVVACQGRNGRVSYSMNQEKQNEIGRLLKG